MVTKHFIRSAGAVLGGAILFLSCSQTKGQDEYKHPWEEDEEADTIVYEITSEGCITILDKFKKVRKDTTLTDKEKQEVHKAQIRNILRQNK